MRHSALVLAALLPAAPLAAESTPAPPDWQDGHGPSVYMAAAQPPPTTGNSSTADRYAVANQTADAAMPAAPAPVITPPLVDASVMPALHTTPATESEPPGRRLAPPSNRSDRPADQGGHVNSGTRKMLDFGFPIQSMYTVVTALAIVIGAFLLFAWALKRGNKNTRSRGGMLPTDAVHVLGRVPLASRQFAELLRVGNKLVLVAMTPSGPTTLTEVTDPAEVDRLVGLCQQFDSHSTTKAFEQVFQQFSNEPTGGTFLGGDPLPTSFSPAASAYRSHRGTARA